MRNYSKTGGKPGRPGYRTPSSFRSKKIRKQLEIKKSVSRKDNLGAKVREKISSRI